jgi:hypothetical protein
VVVAAISGQASWRADATHHACPGSRRRTTVFVRLDERTTSSCRERFWHHTRHRLVVRAHFDDVEQDGDRVTLLGWGEA